MITDETIFRENTELIAHYSIVTLAGRALYRHPNGQGTVIEYDYWGTPSKLFVADAKYRALKKTFDSVRQDNGLHKTRCTSTHFIDLPKAVQSEESQDKVILPEPYLDDPSIPLPYWRNDAWIQKTYADLKNDGTAKSNTDILMTFETTETAHYCRSVSIPGIGPCDVPNLYQVIILYLESDNLDNLDPTIEEDLRLAFGIRNPYGRFGFDYTRRVWASTEYSDVHAYYVDRDGYATYNRKEGLYTAVPVKEI